MKKLLSISVGLLVLSSACSYSMEPSDYHKTVRQLESNVREKQSNLDFHNRANEGRLEQLHSMTHDYINKLPVNAQGEVEFGNNVPNHVMDSIKDVGELISHDQGFRLKPYAGETAEDIKSGMRDNVNKDHLQRQGEVILKRDKLDNELQESLKKLDTFKESNDPDKIVARRINELEQKRQNVVRRLDTLTRNEFDTLKNSTLNVQDFAEGKPEAVLQAIILDSPDITFENKQSLETTVNSMYENDMQRIEKNSNVSPDTIESNRKKRADAIESDKAKRKAAEPYTYTSILERLKNMFTS